MDDFSGAVPEQEIGAVLPANTQFLSPRLYVNKGTSATVVTFD